MMEGGAEVEVVAEREAGEWWKGVPEEVNQ